MKIPELLEDLAIISQLGDNPGSDDGLSAEALKAKFDEAALKIQKYINTVLIPAINPAVIPKDYFAPAGYGFGEPMQMVLADSETDLYNKLDAILATLPDSTSKFIGISCYAVFGTGYTFNCELHNAFNGYATLRGVSYNGLQFFIYKDNGNWFVEWVNPPMIPGKEYCTTERFAGKPVYTTLFDCGTLPSNATASIPIPSPIYGTIDKIIRYGGATSEGDLIPFTWSGEYMIVASASRSNIYIYSRVDNVEKTAEIQLWYTKF